MSKNIRGISDGMICVAHLGWYFFFHMNGPAALPTPYATKIIALTVIPVTVYPCERKTRAKMTACILFVWPAVIEVIHPKASVKGEMAETISMVMSYVHVPVPRKNRTSEPITKQ
jgi:hypothetical protein